MGCIQEELNSNLSEVTIHHMCFFNPLNAELNPIFHMLALLGAQPILHVSRIRVNSNVDLTRQNAETLKK